MSAPSQGDQRLQALIDQAPVPIYVKDRKRRYLLANRAAHEAVGLAPGELVGQTDEEILPPAAERLVAEGDREIIEGGASYKEEEAIILGDRETTFLTIKFPYIDEAGRVAGVIGISTDITAKKQAEASQREQVAAQEQTIDELQRSCQGVVERLANAIEIHDVEAGEHVARVATIAAFLGRQLDLKQDRVTPLRVAAAMHDVGMVAIPDGILRKRGPLTDAERKEVERHTTVGHQVLAGSEDELLRMAATIALTHHEHWDGNGYPQGLRGEDIPLEGRIVAVADAFDALLSDRCYRPAMSVEEAAAILRDGRDTHFDPEVTEVLLSHLEEALSLRREAQPSP